ncbi:MAG: hypothetical protein R2856_32315 [Caldilineaceae bacterium]
MFPDIKYIFWGKAIRDCILGRHVTDDSAPSASTTPKPKHERHRRAISWIYQYKLVKATQTGPLDRRRMEDFGPPPGRNPDPARSLPRLPLPALVHPETVGGTRRTTG